MSRENCKPAALEPDTAALAGEVEAFFRIAKTGGWPINEHDPAILLLRRAARALTTLHTERDAAIAAKVAAETRLGEALAALVAKLGQIEEHPAYRSVFEIAMLHGQPYAGPTYEAELKAARAVLQPATVTREDGHGR